MLNAAWFASATVPSGPITHSGVGAISIAADRSAGIERRRAEVRLVDHAAPGCR